MLHYQPVPSAFVKGEMQSLHTWELVLTCNCSSFIQNISFSKLKLHSTFIRMFLNFSYYAGNLLLLVSLLFRIGLADKIQLFENSNYKGKTISLELPKNNSPEKCISVPEEWMKTVSSFKFSTDGYKDVCVELYQEKNCIGENWVKIPKSKEIPNLEEWGFDKALVSLQNCLDKHSGDDMIIELLDDQNKILKLNIIGCANIPEKWIGKVKKAIIADTCFQYYSTKNCIGSFIKSVSSTKSIASCDWDGTSKTFPVTIATSTIGKSTAKFKLISTTESNVISTPKHRFSHITIIPKSKSSGTKKSSVNEGRGLGKEFVAFIIVSVIAIILTLMILFGVYKYRTAKKIYYERVVELELQNEKFVTDFLAGNPNALRRISFEKADAEYRAQNTPYDAEKFEISYDSLEMDGGKILGKGQHGIVLKAKLNSPKFPTISDVAVKTVKTGSDSGYVKALLDECKIMMYLNADTKHPHIVNLIGACTENLSKLEPYIIIEYCSKGSLHKFLRKRRKTFVNLLQKNGQILPLRKEYQDKDKNVVNTIDLLKWSRDIADGMDYLANRKVCHGDLAVRNILLDENYNVKISDFGLSRQLYQYSLYVKKSEIPLPWRWMAVESIRDMKFSFQSDAWAFGVTMWEIFSLAETPYPGLEWNNLFIKSLNDGYRMSQPIYAPFSVYELMLSCWKELPKDRPLFLELKNELSAIYYFSKGNTDT